MITQATSSCNMFCAIFSFLHLSGRCDKSKGLPAFPPPDRRLTDLDQLLTDDRGQFGYGGMRVHFSCKPGYRQYGESYYECDDKNIAESSWKKVVARAFSCDSKKTRIFELEKKLASSVLNTWDGVSGVDMHTQAYTNTHTHTRKHKKHTEK